MITPSQDAVPTPGGTGTAAVGFHNLPRRDVFITLAGVMLAMFLGSLDQTVVGTAMPRIIADLGGFDRYTWVTTAYLVTSTTMVPIAGRLTDMYGRKRFYIAGIAVFLAGSVLSGVSQTLTQLIVFRGLQGVGGGIMMANAFIVIGDLFPPAERGKYQGFITAIFGLSSVVGPTLGGFITDNLSWHWIFFINIPLGIPVIGLFIRFFPNIRPTVQRETDILGLTALVLCVVPLILGLSWGGVQYDWASPQVVGMLSMSAVMAVVFVLVESRAAQPLIPLGMFRNRVVSATAVISFFTGFGMFAGIIFIPLFFQGVLGCSATASGSFLTPMMLGIVAGSMVSGQVVSRLGGHYRIQCLVGLAVMGVGMFLLSGMEVSTSYARAVVNVVVLGVGLGTALPLYMIAVQNAVPYRVLGVATSSVQFFRQIGGALGLAVLGSLMASRFASNLATVLPESAKDALPPESLSELATDPQVLMDPSAMSRLEGMLEGVGAQAADVLGPLVEGLREALSMAISDSFLVGLAGVGVAFAATLFLKELPLQKRYAVEGPGEAAPAERLAETGLAPADPCAAGPLPQQRER